METLFLNPCFPNPNNWFFSQSTEWTREENKLFEKALAIFDKETPDRWQNIALMVPGKTIRDVITKYQELEEDVSEIEAGRYPIPGYFGSSFTSDPIEEGRDYDGCRKKSSGGRGSDQERKKGVPWTEDEHRRFLKGLLKYGKGDWRNISRNFVFTKTPTQVASHAQKYYIRQQLSGGKDKRRPSIHDITTNNLTDPNPSDDSNTENVGNEMPSSLLDQPNLPPVMQQSSSWLVSGWNWPEERAFRIFRANQCDVDVASSSLKVQEKGLNFGGFHGFSVKPSPNPLFGIQSTRFRIYG